MTKRAATKTSAAPVSAGPMVHADHERRTCIELRRDEDFVTFIPMSIEGMDVQRESVKNFDGRYKPLVDYPVDRAAKLYAEYAADLGGSKMAMDELAKLTNLSTKEIEMATAKKATKATEAKTTAAKSAKPATKAAHVTKGKAAPAKPAKEPKAASGEKKESAAQMFKDLIMEGKLTDDKIFEKVAAKHGLDESKRGYVKWYRNWLTKNGQKPPAAK